MCIRDRFGYDADAAQAITKKAKPKYKAIIADLPEFEKSDRFKMNIVNCAMLGAFILDVYKRQCLKKEGKTVKLTDRAFYAVGIAFHAISLILELLPLGAVLIFAPSPTERVIHTYSYFDLNLVGYANFSPMLTGILTVAVVILGITILCRYEKAKKRKKAVFVCSVIAFVLSFVPLFMFGSDGMTMISYVISAAMAVSICFQAVANRRELSAA